MVFPLTELLVIGFIFYYNFYVNIPLIFSNPPMYKKVFQKLLMPYMTHLHTTLFVIKQIVY